MIDPICLLPLVGFLFVLAVGCFITDDLPRILRFIRRILFMRKFSKESTKYSEVRFEWRTLTRG